MISVVKVCVCVCACIGCHNEKSIFVGSVEMAACQVNRLLRQVIRLCIVPQHEINEYRVEFMWLLDRSENAFHGNNRARANLDFIRVTILHQLASFESCQQLVRVLQNTQVQ